MRANITTMLRRSGSSSVNSNHKADCITALRKEKYWGLFKKKDGVALVEFAIVFPVYVIFIFGLINFGLLSWYQSTLNYAVERASRYALANPTASASTITNVAQAVTSGLHPQPTITISVDANGVVVVQATLAYTFIGMPAFTPINLEAVAKYSEG